MTDEAIAPFDELALSDRDMARITEDILDVLISKGLVSMSDFPQAVQDKMTARKALRP